MKSGEYYGLLSDNDLSRIMDILETTDTLSTQNKRYYSESNEDNNHIPCQKNVKQFIYERGGAVWGADSSWCLAFGGGV